MKSVLAGLGAAALVVLLYAIAIAHDMHVEGECSKQHCEHGKPLLVKTVPLALTCICAEVVGE
jgi:hypothetical protein